MLMFLMSTEAEGEITLLGNKKNHNADNQSMTSVSSLNVYQCRELNNLDCYTGVDVLIGKRCEENPGVASE